MHGFSIRPYDETDAAWAERLMDAEFGGRFQARRGELVDALAWPGFVAEEDGDTIGLLTYRRDGAECELVFLVAVKKHRGIGTALVRALEEQAADCTRIWLVTTNDNLGALRFYQRRGFALSALRPGAVDESRRDLKPQIARIGDFGIPLRDELELEFVPLARPR